MTKKVIGYNNYAVLLKNFINDFLVLFWSIKILFRLLKFYFNNLI